MIPIFNNVVPEALAVNSTTYFILVTIIRLFTVIIIGEIVTGDIMSGKLAMIMVKPVSYVKYSIVKSFASSVVKVILALPLIVGSILWIFNRGAITSISFQQLLVFFLALVGGFWICINICLILGFTSFWFENFFFVHDLNLAALVLMSGSAMPLTIIPEKIRAVFEYLPYHYIIYFQTRIILDESLPEFRYFLVFVGYIVGLYMLANLIYKIGLKRYETYGN